MKKGNGKGMTEAEAAELKELARLRSAEGRPLSSLFPDALPPCPLEFREYGEGIEVENECPKCGYRWS